MLVCLTDASVPGSPGIDAYEGHPGSHLPGHGIPQRTPYALRGSLSQILHINFPLASVEEVENDKSEIYYVTASEISHTTRPKNAVTEISHVTRPENTVSKISQAMGPKNAVIEISHLTRPENAVIEISHVKRPENMVTEISQKNVK
ncbi:hypothetical protein LSH36_131g05029 [Paralvinella palmiformis]|uniref:Uncharacterized protein n=1 Tax=Paralvinella palmiformis TaxID=53620 RepID=A0AAD9NA15_9ANNE|nr:hypothetical protein LSH36_131g05029 [Paralvinella palmiformis]